MKRFLAKMASDFLSAVYYRSPTLIAFCIVAAILVILLLKGDLK